MAKLRKKLVKNNGFWKINTIRSKIKVKRGRTRKYEIEGNAKLGGLVEELGFLFVTQTQILEVGYQRYAELSVRSYTTSLPLMISIRMSIFLSDLYKRNDAFYILWLVIDFVLDLRISQRSILAERLQRFWADVQYLANILVVKPLAMPFVCSSTSHSLHL